jgi:hypothetical protein
MDSDDRYFERDVLQTLYLTAEEKNVDICGGSLCRYINRHIVIEKGKLQFKKDGYIRFEDYQYCKGFYRFIYNREMLINHHICFPYYLRNQDPPFMLNAMLHAGTFYALKKIVYWHCVQPGHVNWTHQKLCDSMRGTAYLLHVSRQHNLERLHTDLVKQYIEELDNINIDISDLKDKKIRKAIEVINNEIDYGLVKKQKLLGKYENIKVKTMIAILYKSIFAI